VINFLLQQLLRGVAWLGTRLLYRVRVVGREHVPAAGGALLVSNHLSLMDAMLVQVATRRPIRFLMAKDIYERSLIRPLARLMQVIPISPRQRPREMIQALRMATEAIHRGELVCIFAEGQITRIGQLLPFRRGLERIMRGVDAPIIPVCLDGVWGSIFSFEGGRFFWKRPRRIPHPVTVLYGAPMPANSSPFEVRGAVQALSVEGWHYRREGMRPLPRAFVSLARRHPFRFAMADARVPRLRLGAALTRAIYLARRLRPIWEGQAMVGILLPPSVGGALVNWAALLLGKIPVNLNYTASPELVASCLRQCGIDAVVTSRAFVEKARLTVPGRALWLEALAAQPRLSERLIALAMTWLLPVRWLERALGVRTPVSLNDLATVIFSSGSTGDPKGVMLTHYNIVSNIEQLGQTFGFRGGDRFLGVLPFFHSFGYTGTLCLPGVLGCGVVFHPTPLDTEAVANLARDYGITFLLSTPTFLQLYLRSVDAEDFGSVQFVLAGAEKLPERLALAFEEKFGIRPLEGYGCTECAPAVTVNTRDFRAAGLRQVGAKRGRIGHPLPGMTVQIVHPATLQPQPVNQPGLLLVRGPNVMKGYLGRPDLTAQAFQDGWYVTGDIATEDEDGFLQITDRLSRFSKIGGEMVPHIRVEEKLHDLAGVTEQTFVVSSAADEKKGERLVVLHTLPEERLRAVLDKLAQCDLPNLWIPRPNQFFRVASFPVLGTGKLDLRQVREVATRLSNAEAAAA
jgi:acyl-[acyl-carrier-protein]-phospholipid O-acyltransferase/long-chain-fatty-acid--[acyl-carrier-protein] ligase